MSARELQAALQAMYIDGTVEAHGKVAVLVTPSPEQLASGDVRTAVLDAALHHGFRTVAIELAGHGAPSDFRFPLPDGADLHRP